MDKEELEDKMNDVFNMNYNKSSDIFLEIEKVFDIRLKSFRNRPKSKSEPEPKQIFKDEFCDKCGYLTFSKSKERAVDCECTYDE